MGFDRRASNRASTSARSHTNQLLRSCNCKGASASPQQPDGPPARSIVPSVPEPDSNDGNGSTWTGLEWGWMDAMGNTKLTEAASHGCGRAARIDPHLFSRQVRARLTGQARKESLESTCGISPQTPRSA